MHPSSRFDTIDAWRGVAIVWMTIFHFCFDLAWFGWTKQNFYDDMTWIAQRSAIVSLFLFCAGMSQAVAAAQGQSWSRFWKRWGQIAGCAVLVTVASYVMFPRSFIYFGILHGIAVMLVIVRLTAGWGRWLWLAGAIAIALKWVGGWAMAQSMRIDFLNDRAWNWLGIIDRKPVTEDYVPLVPWLGVMWWGMAAGQWLMANRRDWLSRPLPRATAPLQWLGRWSLTWYMLHQPVMIGALMVLK